MKGVPLRLEIGPSDIENGQCVLVRRDTREKQFVKLDELETAIPAAGGSAQGPVRACPAEPREAHLRATTMDEVKELPRPTPASSRPCGAATWPARMKMKEEGWPVQPLHAL